MSWFGTTPTQDDHRIAIPDTIFAQFTVLVIVKSADTVAGFAFGLLEKLFPCTCDMTNLVYPVDYEFHFCRIANNVFIHKMIKQRMFIVFNDYGVNGCFTACEPTHFDNFVVHFKKNGSYLNERCIDLIIVLSKIIIQR